MRTCCATVAVTMLLVVPLTAQDASQAGAVAPESLLGTSVPNEIVAAAVVRAVKERMGSDAEVTVRDLDVVGARFGGSLVAIPAPGARTGGAIRFQLLGSADDGRVRQQGWVTASVRVSVEHVRARQLLERGRPVTEGAVEASSDEVTNVPLRRLPRLREVAGALVLAPVAEGAVVTKTAVASRPAVRSGQTVRATARVGAVHVVAELVAVQDGDPGAMVRVVNKVSRRELRARVVEPGLVEVINE